MAEFDPRIVRVSIEIDGSLNVFEGLWVTASGKKYANPKQNECEVRIANLRRESADYLLKETSPFNQTKRRKRIIVDAGRESFGVFRLFEGDITECSTSQPPDSVLTIKAKTGQFDKGNVVSSYQAATTPLSTIAKAVADTLGLSLVFEATDRNVANYSFTGGALRQVDRLSDVGGVNAFVDDGRLIVKNYNVPLREVSHVLSAKSGLVGLPETTEQGVKVRFFLVPSVKLGGQLAVESAVNPAVNGDYTIYQLAFEVSNRDVPFYYIAECKRKGTK